MTGEPFVARIQPANSNADREGPGTEAPALSALTTKHGGGAELSPIASFNVLLVVADSMDPRKREQVTAGERPRIDILEMEKRFGARTQDFSYLTGPKGLLGLLLAMLARRVGLWSLWLALGTLGQARKADAIYATDEDIGVPLAILLRLTRSKRPGLVVRMEQPTYGRNAARQMAFNLYLRAALPRIDMVLSRTTAHRDYLSSILRVPLDRVTFIREPVDTVFFAPGSGTAKRAQAKVEI